MSPAFVRVVAVGSLIVLGCLGCGPTSRIPPLPEPGCVADPPPAASPAVIGGKVVEGAFVALAPGDGVAAVSGPQGGTHIDVGARVFGAGENYEVAMMLESDGPLTGTTAIGIDCEASWAEVFGRILDPGGPDEVLQIVVSTSAGEIASADIPVTIE